MTPNVRTWALATMMFELGCAAAHPPPAPTTPPPTPTAVPELPAVYALASREDLPPTARAALEERMRTHRDQMGALTLAVWVLDYPLVEQLASALANESIVGTPASHADDPLFPRLPPSFFVYQRELRQASALLAGAARDGDDARIDAAFGTVAHCCVGCHSAYLHEPLGAPATVPVAD